MRIKRYKKKRDLPLWLLKIALVIAVFCLCISFFYNRVRPVVITAAQNQAKVVISRELNKAISEELSKNAITYSDIVTLSRDKDGRVTSIETNTATANFFKAKLVTTVLAELKNIEEQKLSIPVGSLSDVPFLYGKGPKVDFKLSTSGIANAEFKSEFFSAGINQTCHRIKLVVTAKVFALVPGFVTSTTLTTDYYIAETVIVGVTPDFFADIG